MLTQSLNTAEIDSKTWGVNSQSVLNSPGFVEVTMGRNTIDLRRLSGTPFPFKSRETLLRTALHKTFTWTVILSLGLLFSFAHAIPSKISSAEDSRIFSNPNIMVSVGGDFA